MALVAALNGKKWEEVRTLLEKGYENINETDKIFPSISSSVGWLDCFSPRIILEIGWTALHRACLNGNDITAFEISFLSLIENDGARRSSKAKKLIHFESSMTPEGVKGRGGDLPVRRGESSFQTDIDDSDRNHQMGGDVSNRRLYL
jgi:ankyrin repeat protein